MNVSECQEIVGCGLGSWNVVLDVRVNAEMWRTEKEFENWNALFFCDSYMVMWQFNFFLLYIHQLLGFGKR